MSWPLMTIFWLRAVQVCSFFPCRPTHQLTIVLYHRDINRPRYESGLGDKNPNVIHRFTRPGGIQILHIRSAANPANRRTGRVLSWTNSDPVWSQSRRSSVHGLRKTEKLSWKKKTTQQLRLLYPLGHFQILCWVRDVSVSGAEIATADL